jgi:bifunctional non-homologous end joining protein LigD
LQQYGTNDQVQLVYYVFDLLYVNGKSVEEKPLGERKEMLKKMLPSNDLIKYCDHIKGKGKEFFSLMADQGLEGMIAKRADSKYYEGTRSEQWLKIKLVQTEEAVICGFTEPKGSRKYFGSLILGMYDKGKLRYIGHTGTGFNDKSLKQLHQLFQQYITTDHPFREKIPVNGKVTWLKPELVCNIKYSEITQQGIRRHPVFLGLRDDKAPVEATEDQNKMETKKSTKAIKNSASNSKEEGKDNVTSVGGRKLKLTNLDKLYFPDEGITKGDMINYYDKISKYILKYLKDRPESLRRTPNGIKDEGFFHKDIGSEVPEWIDRYPIWSDSAGKTINYIVCNDKPTLLVMANMGCIEINPWNSRTTSPDNPDYLVMDLDPSDDNTFDQVIECANVIHDILEKAGCKNYCKTSGSSGLHIYVPLGAKYDYEQARMFAEMVARLTVDQLPDITSIERSLKKRGKDKIYVDYLQNKQGQTLSSVYSARPKPGAPVSTPLEWKEVKPGLSPKQFTIKNIFSRLEKKGDLFAPVLKAGINMEKVLKKLG